MTWEPVVPGIAPLPELVRVTTRSETLELQDPVIEADSVLLGTRATGLRANEPVRFPLDGLLLIEERRVDSFRTFVLAWVGVSMLLGVLLQGA